MIGNILTMVREQSRQQEQRYIDAFPGWKHSTLLPCPRVVAGKRCYRGDWRHVPECICTRYGRRIFDHTRTWRTPEGYRVLTTEPYNVDLDDLMAFRDECRGLGLAVELFAHSPYSPGYAVILMIHRADQVVRHDLIG